MKMKGFFLVLLLLAGVLDATGQQAKKALDHDAYDVWNRINEHAISDDGRWALFSMSPEYGDAELRVKSLTSDQAYSVPRGVSARFTEDARFVAFSIKPPKEAVRQAKLDEKKDDEMPKDSLGLLDLSTGAVTRIGRVKSFKLPEEGAGFVAYHLEKAPAEADSMEKNVEMNIEKNVEKPEEGEDKKKDKKKKQEGTPLVLRNLATGAETRFEHATEYLFSEDGSRLVYTAANKDGSADAIVVVTTATGATNTLMAGKGAYKQPAFDEAGNQLAFLSNRDDQEAEQPAFTLYHWRVDTEAPQALSTAGIPDGWWIGEHGDLEFSKEGTRLFFGTAPRPEPEPEDDEIPDDEKVVLDVWNWKDPLLQPMQLVQLEQEKKRTYRAMVHLADGRVVQLADETTPDVVVGREGEADVAVGNSNMPYRQEISWDSPRYYDVYFVDVETGARRRVIEELQSRAILSPGARYIHWWDRDDVAWYAMSVEGGEPVNLTGQIPHAFHNELHDWPFKPNPYGEIGWTESDEAFLVYDRHDIWVLDPTGARAPRNVTEGRGRADDLRFRYVRLDPDEQTIDPDAPMLLSAFNYETKASGFYRDQAGGTRAPQQLVMTDRRFSNPQKAEDTDALLFTREHFEEFPDLWTSSPDFDDMRRVSDANPQQAGYLWGTAELVEWTSLDGIPLKGILYKPEGFDPSQKYPMMVYFYEKMSDGLHQHRAPATSRSSINFSFYVSRGYLVFVPDIPYKVGYPGESALNAVVPGVTKLINQGFVEEDNVGVQGHSWGGYQIAYMVTETNLFKAAEAGAPVSNMTSAYGGIRWGSGMSRMFQYEKSQSRIGGTLWEYPLRYIDNSPLFQADKIETPVLMMHNDEDGAVPWYQGIEFFVALRRLGKPVWMLNYNGEAHGLRQYHNKRDFAIRMQQFFDHYLKGAPAPVWMEEGVPAIKKGKTLGLEPASAPTPTVTVPTGSQ